MLTPSDGLAERVLNGNGDHGLDLSAQWRSGLVLTNNAEGCRIRVSFEYRAENEPGKRGAFRVVLLGKNIGRGDFQNAYLASTDEFWHLASFAFDIPSGVRKGELCLRVDDYGRLSFRNVRATRVQESVDVPPVEVFNSPHGWLGRDYAVPSNGVALVNYMWRLSNREECLQGKYECVVRLPQGFELLAPLNAKPGSVRTLRGADGSSETRFETPLRPPRGRLDWWRRLGFLVTTEAPHGVRGRATFGVEVDGKLVSNLEPLEMFVHPETKGARVDTFDFGVALAGRTGFVSGDAVADRRLAEYMAGCGVSWIKGFGADGALQDVWRAAGIRRLTPEMPIQNAYALVRGDANVPQGERFEALHPKNSVWLAKSLCPTAIYREKPYFMTNVVPRIRVALAGADGGYANWEPFFFRREGCLCASCRQEFASWLGVPESETIPEWTNAVVRTGRFGERFAKFRSWQHGQVALTIDRHVREATGGASSMGLIPAVHYEQVGRNWIGVHDDTEFDLLDYGKHLTWICPWGPYSGFWNAETPYVPRGTAILKDFYNARESIVSARRDYPDVKMMAYPHGLQGSSWVIQPELLELNLLAYFFNGWDAALIYYFPMGYDARYWAGVARASVIAASYENFVRRGRRVDDRVALRVKNNFPSADATAYDPLLRSFRNVSYLQHVAYALDGSLAVAVFNYHPDRTAEIELNLPDGTTRQAVLAASSLIVLEETCHAR